MIAADLWGVFGIVVSVVLFLVGYRQTVGAKKERVVSANQEVEKILVRRVVLEGYVLGFSAVGRLLEGKARDFRVRPGDLLSEEQVLNGIFTRVLESDFLSHEKREDILKRLMSMMVRAEEDPVGEQKLSLLVPSRGVFFNRTAALGLMGALASVIGSLFAVFPTLVNLDTSYPEVVAAMIATAAASGVIITAIILFSRFRESQQEVVSKADALVSGAAFEREVVNHLAKAGFTVRTATDEGYDFCVEHDGRKILLELKAWSRPMPLRLVAHVAERLRQIVEREGASEAIVVTPGDIVVPQEIVGSGIKVMALPALRNYLVYGRPK